MKQFSTADIKEKVMSDGLEKTKLPSPMTSSEAMVPVTNEE